MSEGTVLESGGEQAASILESGATPPVETPASQPENWRTQHLSNNPDLFSNATLAEIPDVETLAKNHVNVQKLIGADKIPRPQEDWTQEQHDDFWTKLGRPADPKDYNLEGVEPPEGVPFDEGFQTEMVGTMHKLGLNSEQVRGLLGAYNESVGGQFQQQTGDAERNRESALQDLRNEWGSSYEPQKDLAMRAFRAGAGEGFEQLANIQLADGGLLGDNPEVIKAFAAIGGKMSEHGLVGATASRSTLTSKESLAGIAKLESESAHILNDKNHPEHELVVAKRNTLYASAYPEEQ
jgi:hypothetical protein